MSLVRVWTNVGQRKPKALVAKIFQTSGPLYSIRYLSPVSEEDERGRTVHRYEEDVYEVDDDSIAEWLHTDTEEDIGYSPVDEDAWVREDTDSDYVPSSSDEDPSEDEDEDETEDEEDDDEELDEENSSDEE